jgi:GT2 family glycosyltransferase
MPKVHIGIVSYNSLVDLPACIASVRVQTYLNWTLTIYDNASTDGSLAWLQTLSEQDIHLIVGDRNIGFGAAHNRIIATLQLSPEDFYLALNPDVQLAADYLEVLVRGLQEVGAGWGTGKLLLPESTPQRLYSVGHAMFPDGYAINIGYGLVDNQPLLSTPREVFGAPGAAALYRMALLKDLVLQDGIVFDEDLFMYYEDVDLDWRAHGLGWCAWCIPAAVAMHRGGVPSDLLRDYALANRYLVLIKNAAKRQLLFVHLPQLLLHLGLRSMITPRRGIWLLKRTLTHTPAMIKKRRLGRLRKVQLQRWWHWARVQPTASPRSYRQRWLHFLRVQHNGKVL